MRAFREAGVTRCSIGIQSFEDKVLKWMNRSHTGKDAVKAINVATNIFNNGVTFDLIYGVPNQTLENLGNQLNFALNLSDSHFSAYQLTVEYGTALYKQVQDKSILMPDSELMADMYEHIYSVSKSRGLDRYEISNYAKGSGNEGMHNKNYWNGTDYFGIGPGAHSRITVLDETLRSIKKSEINIRDPKNYINSVLTTQHALAKSRMLSENESLNELTLFGLRSKYGVSDKSYKLIGDGSHTLKNYLLLDKVKKYTDQRLLLWGIDPTNNHSAGESDTYLTLAPTVKGMMVVDSIIADIIP
ncbi:hypothetical protein BB561_004050 [Smittium simulii]|uniref:Radical SAM core domain-containing protein n=1 Tax=Smittium simulii TaxID=133385 RepID=A0A2T9YIB0_9FUNG|nr:hypothetical protein BB561_004050 [Smittium simulii]